MNEYLQANWYLVSTTKKAGSEILVPIMKPSEMPLTGMHVLRIGEENGYYSLDELGAEFYKVKRALNSAKIVSRLVVPSREDQLNRIAQGHKTAIPFNIRDATQNEHIYSRNVEALLSAKPIANFDVYLEFKSGHDEEAAVADQETTLYFASRMRELEQLAQSASTGTSEEDVARLDERVKELELNLVRPRTKI